MRNLHLGAAGWRWEFKADRWIWHGAWFGAPRTRWSQIWLIPSLFPAQLITLGGKSKDLEVCVCYFTCQQSPHPLILQTLSSERLPGSLVMWAQPTGECNLDYHINHTHFRPGKGHTSNPLSIIHFQWDYTVYWSSVRKVQGLWYGETRWEGEATQWGLNEVWHLANLNSVSNMPLTVIAWASDSIF